MARLTATHQRTNTRHNGNHSPRRWRLLLPSWFPYWFPSGFHLCCRSCCRSCCRPCFYSCCRSCFIPCCRSCFRLCFHPCFCPCCWSCFYSCNVSDGWRLLFLVLLPSLFRSLVVGLAVGLASILVMSPTGGGSCWRSLECLQPVASLFRLWHSLECLPTVADPLPPLLLVNSLLHIRLNVCCLLYIRLNVYPLPP